MRKLREEHAMNTIHTFYVHRAHMNNALNDANARRRSVRWLDASRLAV